jgi:hypothetical protein
MNKGHFKKVFWPSSHILQLKQKYPRYFLGLVLIIGIASLSIALLVYAYLGTFSRYYADDYCLSGMFFAMGLPKAVTVLYQTWSSSYAGTILISLSELFGRLAIRFWLAFILVLWVPTLAWALLQVNRLLRLNFSKRMLLVLAEMLVLFTVMESPNLFQTLFWRIGLIVYTMPLVFLAALMGLILNGVMQARDGDHTRSSMILGLAGSVGITIFAGGLSETYVTLQTGLLGLALFCALLGARGKMRLTWLLWLGVALIGSLVAMMIVILAPGNAVRQASMPPPPGVIELILASAKNAFIFIRISLQDYSFQIVLLFVLSVLMTYVFVTSNTFAAKPRPSWLISALFLVPLIGYMLIMAICAPSVYGESSYPEARVLIEARFVMVLSLSMEGMIIGVILSQLHALSHEAPPFFLRAVAVLASIVLLLYPLYDARKLVAQVPDYRARAAAWDMRDAQIRADKGQGLKNIQVEEFDSISGISELRPDAGFWVNGCAANFYGVRSIEAITLP